MTALALTSPSGGAAVVGAASGRENGDAVRVFRFADPAITESSGLVVVGDRVVTVNDSGNDAVLFVVDPATGRTERTVRFAEEQVDVEALAPGPGDQVWVGDIGDNAAQRTSISVTRVSLGTGRAATHSLGYPRGRAFDAEALLADPRTGRLYVVTKGLLGGRVFVAPRRLAPGTNRLRPVGRVPGLVTDGAFLPGGERVVLRGYGSATVVRPDDWSPIGTVPLPDQPQGEAVAAAGPGEVLISSEGARTAVWRVPIPGDLLAADPAPGSTGTSPGGEATGSPSPDQGAAGETSATSETAAAVTRPAPWGVAAAAAGVGIGLVWWVRRRRRGR